MHVFRKAAVVTAAAGLLAFGAVAGSGGPALASPSPRDYVTGCQTEITGQAVGQTPSCRAYDGTAVNPTYLVIWIDASALANMINLQPGIALDTSWTLSCVVNGRMVSSSGSDDLTSAAQENLATIDLQSAVGSPEPNSCTVTNLTVTTSQALGESFDAYSDFTIGAVAETLTAVPGAVYQSEGTTAAGAPAMLCADDTANGNAGSRIQAYRCVSDLAEAFVRTGTGQLVHNGDCLGLSGARVVLAACTANDTAQQWAQSAAGGPVRNARTRTCLTLPSGRDGTQLTVASCDGGARQKWHLPAASIYIPTWAARSGRVSVP